MYNLLPEEKKKGVKKEYRFRLYSIILLAFSAAFFSGTVFLFPSYLFSTIELRNLTEQKDAETEKTEKGTVGAELQRLRGKLQGMELLEKRDRFSTLLDTLGTLRGEGVKIKTIGFHPDREGTNATLSLSGNASTRDSLQVFADRLRKSEALASTTIDLPVGVFAKKENIQFNMTITGSL